MRRDDGFAEFWLSPVDLQHSGNLRPTEIRRIRRIVERDQARFLEERHAFFNR
ncbi:MAG: hypothetical protein OXG38_06395 [Chloroflexi bacterium]|nr:hypothetical protein [Chloroflexota bacterium]